MLFCPNRNSPEWIALEESVGQFEALKDFMQHNGEIRTPEAVKAKIADSKPQPVKEAAVSEEAQFKKLISLSKKQISGAQRASINSKVKMANGKLGTSFYVKFTPVGQADIWTWEIQNMKGKYSGQTTMFYREGEPTG